MAELRGHAREVLGHPDAVLILDPSGFPKSGGESCGVARQWCGRLGKQDNCQLGVFLAYAAPGGYAPLDRRLYLPKDWADDPARPAGPSATSPRGSDFRSRAVRHERPRPGVPPSPTAACRPGPQAGGAVPPRRRLGGAATGLPLDPTDGPRRRAGTAAGRCHDRAGAGQGRAADRAGGAPGGDAHRRGEAPDRGLTERRRRRSAAVRVGPGAVHTTSDRGGVRRGERGSRAGAVRGAGLGGLAPPHEVVVPGAVVPDPGADPGRGGKPRR